MKIAFLLRFPYSMQESNKLRLLPSNHFELRCANKISTQWLPLCQAYGRISVGLITPRSDIRGSILIQSITEGALAQLGDTHSHEHARSLFNSMMLELEAHSARISLKRQGLTHQSRTTRACGLLTKHLHSCYLTFNGICSFLVLCLDPLKMNRFYCTILRLATTSNHGEQLCGC